MVGSVSGMKVAVLVTDGFEQSELTQPKKALEEAGAQALIISPAGKQVRGWKHKEWGDSFPVDVALDEAQPGDYSALLLRRRHESGLPPLEPARSGIRESLRRR